MALTLHWRDATRLPVNGSTIRPDLLAQLSPRDAATRSLRVGNSDVPIGDLFTATESPDPHGTLVLVGDLSRVSSVGRGMVSGRLVIRGDLGSHAGAKMSGGRLDVHGSVGPWAGAEMRGGMIHVRADAGDHLGSALPGSLRGMRDGVIIVEGQSGDRAGQSMRRGLIAVGGALGSAAAHAMIAGSLFAFGVVGANPGLGMKRGTLLLAEPPPDSHLLPTFLPSGLHSPPVLALYLKELAALGFAPAARRIASVRRYNGDFSVGGQGEILVAAS